MPRSCCVFNCTNNSSKNTNVRFYVIPKDEQRRKKWLNAIGRPRVDENGKIDLAKAWSPKSRWTYVCSKHFITGVKSSDCTHPDYIPTIFSHKSATCTSVQTSTLRCKKIERHDRHARRSISNAERNKLLKVRKVKKRLDLDARSRTAQDTLKEVDQARDGRFLLDTCNKPAFNNLGCSTSDNTQAMPQIPSPLVNMSGPDMPIAKSMLEMLLRETMYLREVFNIED